MSEEENAPKKTARKRVVKKGVRGSRAPRKKTVTKTDDAAAEAVEETVELISPPNEEQPVEVAEEGENPPEATNEVAEAQPQIEVVTEDAPVPVPEGSRKEEKQKGEDKSGPEGSEESSEREGEGRNRKGRNRRGGSRERDDSQPKRTPVDKEEAAVKAWEIYQGELEEEGVSLVDPRRAREVARRCLELATIFCEERDRYLKR